MLSSLIALGQAIRSLPPETDPYQPLKTRVVDYIDSSGNIAGHQLQVFLYNATGGALTANRLYMVEYDGDEETNPSVVACAAVTTDRNVVVSTEATATTSWGWFVFCGYADCGIEGTTDVAKDDYLKIVAGTSAVAFVKDGTSMTTDTFAIACEAQAADSVVTKKVFLLGRQADLD